MKVIAGEIFTTWKYFDLLNNYVPFAQLFVQIASLFIVKRLHIMSGIIQFRK